MWTWVVAVVALLALLTVVRVLQIREWRRSRENHHQGFVDTPEAWEARKVVPGETREQARARLEKYRREK